MSPDDDFAMDFPPRAENVDGSSEYYPEDVTLTSRDSVIDEMRELKRMMLL
jgi:hypothetical protein